MQGGILDPNLPDQGTSLNQFRKNREGSQRPQQQTRRRARGTVRLAEGSQHVSTGQGGPASKQFSQGTLPQTSTLPELPFFAALLAVGDSVRMTWSHASPLAQTPGSSASLPTWISLLKEQSVGVRCMVSGGRTQVQAEADGGQDENQRGARPEERITPSTCTIRTCQQPLPASHLFAACLGTAQPANHPNTSSS